VMANRFLVSQEVWLTLKSKLNPSISTATLYLTSDITISDRTICILKVKIDTAKCDHCKIFIVYLVLFFNFF